MGKGERTLKERGVERPGEGHGVLGEEEEEEVGLGDIENEVRIFHRHRRL